MTPDKIKPELKKEAYKQTITHRVFENLSSQKIDLPPIRVSQPFQHHNILRPIKVTMPPTTDLKSPMNYNKTPVVTHDFGKNE